MFTYDQTDSILCNIIAAAQKRMRSQRKLSVSIDRDMDEFEGIIDGDDVRSGSYTQLVDTLGRIIRNPRLTQGRFVSQKRVCGMYFATHFKNYLDAAPLGELFDYIDDLAFWGMNTLRLWFDMHHYRDMEEGMEKVIRLKAIIKHAKSMGIKIAITTLANEAFKDSPEALRADWTSGHDGYVRELDDHYHLEICPSADGGMEKILEYRRQMLEAFKDISPDYINIGPYDEGGCTCKKCAPWGGNGYVRTLKALIPLYREYFPNAKIGADFWKFGDFTDDDTEYVMFYKELEEGLGDSIDFISAEPAYAKYPFEHETSLPLVGFPEISMYGAWPWGGYGTNPMPKRLDRWWSGYGSKLDGGFPYSEGIYEDINKVIMLKLYRDNQPAEATVREYLSHEFSIDGELLDKSVKAVMDMEETLDREYEFPFKKNRDGSCEYLLDKAHHRYPILHPEKAEDIERVITEVNNSLPQEIRKSVKWQMIYLRAVIDAEIVRNQFCRNEKILECFNNLVELMHLENSGFYTKPDVFEP